MFARHVPDLSPLPSRARRCARVCVGLRQWRQRQRSWAQMHPWTARGPTAPRRSRTALWCFRTGSRAVATPRSSRASRPPSSTTSTPAAAATCPSSPARAGSRRAPMHCRCGHAPEPARRGLINTVNPAQSLSCSSLSQRQPMGCPQRRASVRGHLGPTLRSIPGSHRRGGRVRRSCHVRVEPHTQPLRASHRAPRHRRSALELQPVPPGRRRPRDVRAGHAVPDPGVHGGGGRGRSRRPGLEPDSRPHPAGDTRQ